MQIKAKASGVFLLDTKPITATYFVSRDGK